MQRIAHYKIMEKLGTGGMGEVYRAFDPVLERDVAIKVMHKHLLDNKKHDSRFLTEARAVAKIDHPNIVTIYEIGKEDCGRYIVMEYVKGDSVTGLLHSPQKMPLELSSNIIVQVLNGIDAAHTHGVFHRDIKPDNILVDSESNVKILDFGIAKVQSSVSITMAGDILGTVEYMAPEQMLGELVDHRCDIYAAGVVYYLMLTNRLPYTGEGPVEILFKKLNEDPIPPSYFNPKLPASLDQVVLKALKKEKEERWASALEFAQAVENCFDKKSTTEYHEEKTSSVDEEAPETEKSIDVVEPNGFRSVFVGREKEFKKLVGHFRTTEQGTGQTVILLGEAGVGKSSLADYFKNYLSNNQAFILSGECLYQEGLDPYLPFIDALRKFIERDSHKLTVEGREQLKESIREKVPLLTEFTERFATIFSGKEFENVSEKKRMVGNLSEGISFIISQLSELKPVVFIIDDLHWADEASLHLFHYLSRVINQKRILLMGISRTDRYDLQPNGKPGSIVEMLSRMRQEGNSHQIELKRLKKEECDLLVDKCLTNTLFSEEFYESIYKETKGNPFFINETLKVLQESGSIFLKDGTWVDTQDGFKLEVPNRVEDVFVRRLRSLSDDEREILQVAAVIGLKFDISLLSRLLEIRKINLIKTLHRIERELEILVSTENGFQFEHPMLRDLLYDEIPVVLAKEYHLMTAAEMENILGDEPGAQVGEIAQHYLKGSDISKAIPLLFQAGRRAYKISAFRESIIFFEDLLETESKRNKPLPDSIPLTELYMKLGISYEEIGKWDMGLDTYKKLLELSRQANDAEGQIDALRRIGRIYDKRGKWELALQQYQYCLQIIDEHQLENTASRIYNNIGVIYFQQGDYDKSLQYFQNTLDSIDSKTDESDRAHALTNMGTVFILKGDYQAALDSNLKALEIYEKNNNPKYVLQLYHNLGMTYLYMKEWNKAIELFEKCFSIMDDVEDRQLRGLTHLNMGKALAHQGELKKAKNNVNKALKMFKRMSDILSEAECYHVFGIICMERQKYVEAEKYFQESIKINEEKNYYEGIAENYFYYGHLNREVGKYEFARDCYKKSAIAYDKLNLTEKSKELNKLINELPEAEESEITQFDTKVVTKAEIRNYGTY